MKRRIVNISAVLLQFLFVHCVVVSSGTAVAVPDDVDPFVKGQQLVENNEPVAALDYWESVYISMKEEGRHDPRIGFRYIETAVTSWQVERYPLATEIHAWGLEASFEEQFYDAVEREIKMTEPILDSRTAEQWNELLENRDDRLFRKIREFWNDKNLIPSTDQNERLIEHWERIRDAKSFFTENRKTVYEADDRALVYVRLGPPDRQESGTLTSNGMEVRNRLYDLVDFGMISTSQVSTLQMNILQNYSPGPFEYWRYDHLSEDGPVIFLFGRPSGAGRFRLLESLEDFISANGYRAVPFGRRGGASTLQSGYFLQFMLYNEMAAVDHYFATRLQDYEQSWYQAVSHDGIRGHLLGNRIAPDRAAHDMEKIRERAPASVSAYERKLQGYPIYHRNYRFLDEKEGPVNYVMMSTLPRLLVAAHMTSSLEKGHIPAYLIKQGAILMQEDEQASKHVEELHPRQTGARIIDELFQSGIKVPVPDKPEAADVSLQLFSELYTYPDQKNTGDYEERLIGLSRSRTDLPPPLDDDGTLMMSDLVVGRSRAAPLRVRSEEIGAFPGNEISRSENLQIYFEVYNLSSDESGEHHYQITYKLVKEEENRAGSGSDEVSVTWEASTERSRDSQFFDVDLTDADTGNQMLVITIEDQNTGNMYSRNEDLVISE